MARCKVKHDVTLFLDDIDSLQTSCGINQEWQIKRKSLQTVELIRNNIRRRISTADYKKYFKEVDDE